MWKPQTQIKHKSQTSDQVKGLLVVHSKGQHADCLSKRIIGHALLDVMRYGSLRYNPKPHWSFNVEPIQSQGDGETWMWIPITYTWMYLIWSQRQQQRRSRKKRRDWESGEKTTDDKISSSWKTNILGHIEHQVPREQAIWNTWRKDTWRKGGNGGRHNWGGRGFNKKTGMREERGIEIGEMKNLNLETLSFNRMTRRKLMAPMYACLLFRCYKVFDVTY